MNLLQIQFQLNRHRPTRAVAAAARRSVFGSVGAHAACVRTKPAALAPHVVEIVVPPRVQRGVVVRSFSQPSVVHGLCASPWWSQSTTSENAGVPKVLSRDANPIRSCVRQFVRGEYGHA